MNLMDSSKNKTRYYIILFIIILLQISRIVYTFACLKEGTHSDEIWSYGLANSYYEPFIYDTYDHGEMRNNDQWLSSQVMRDYLTVDREHRFSYDSVYFNQIYENHPFLFYCLLHTVCSLFPGTFSLWYGFAINIIAFIVTILFFYKLLFEISKSEVTALIGSAFYGFSLGAVNTFIFVRMYALLVMLTTVFLFLHARLYNNSVAKKNNLFIMLFVFTLLGTLTHHFFIPFAACVSACFCIYYLLNKRIKELVLYSVTMLGSVAVSLLIFPATFRHLFSETIKLPKYTPTWQFMLTLNSVTKELFGVRLSPVSKISYTALMIVVVFIIVMILPLVYLVRNESWLKKIVLVLKRCPGKIAQTLKSIDLMTVAMFVSSSGIVVLTAAKVSVIAMGDYIDRYVFFTFPGFCVAFVLFVRWVFHALIKNKKVSVVVSGIVCGLVCLVSNLYPCHYLFPKPEDSLSVKKEISGSNCVFISSEYWLLTCFSEDSMDAEYIYAIELNDSEILKEKILKLPVAPDTNCDLYYYVDNHLFYESEVMDGELVGEMPSKGVYTQKEKKMERNDFETLLKSKYSKAEYVGYGTVFKRNYSLYKVK